MMASGTFLILLAGLGISLSIDVSVGMLSKEFWFERMEISTEDRVEYVSASLFWG